MTQITESSLSRVWQHYNDPTKSICLLTAFRGDYTYEENVARNKSLAADIRNAGYGFFYVDGNWIENQGTPNERKVKEDSLFVIGKSDDKDFANNLHKLGNQFNQDAIFVKDSAGSRFINKDGSVNEVGQLSPGSLGTAYTKLRNNKQANTFTFTEERDDIGFIARLAGLGRK